MKTLLQTFCILLTTVLLCSTSYAQSDTLTVRYGMGADTYVSNDDQYKTEPPGGSGPESVHGTEQHVKIRNHEVRKKITYLKFDISDNPRFEGANEAFIGLYVKHAEKMADTNLTVSVYGMTDDFEDNWADTLMSYSTAPGMFPADLNSFDLDYAIIEYLTDLVIWKDHIGYVYTTPSEEMDAFINDDENDLLTFIFLVEEPNGGDEVRIASVEDTTTNAPPFLHGSDPIISVEDKTLANFKLNQNHPNPFTGITTLSYQLNEPTDVELKIFNMVGKEVTTLVNDFQSTGKYSIQLNMNELELPAGMYCVRMNAGTVSKTIKMTYQK